MPDPTEQSRKVFKAHYLLFRLGGNDMPDRIGGQPMPNKRHRSAMLAFKEVELLNTHDPETTFVVMREIGRVKQIPKKEESDDQR